MPSLAVLNYFKQRYMARINNNFKTRHFCECNGKLINTQAFKKKYVQCSYIDGHMCMPQALNIPKKTIF